MKESAWARTERKFRSVPCPKCKAKKGQPCIAQRQGPRQYLFGTRVHRERSLLRRAKA